MNRELLQQALNALLISAPLGHAMEDYEYRHRLIKDIETELAKPEQEELIQFKDGKWSYVKKPWVGLTDDDVSWADGHSHGNTTWTKQKSFSRAIEAKLKEKNHGSV
jgi:hypothetical protein